MRYALINISTSLVENVIELDPDGDLTQPEGYEVVASDTASIGDTYADGVFTPPPPPVLTPDQIVAANTLQQTNLMSIPSRALMALLMSADMGNRTDAAAVKIRDWQAYFTDLQAVDLTVMSPAWPIAP